MNKTLLSYLNSPIPLKEKITSSLGAFLAILLLVNLQQFFVSNLSIKLLILASMGASTFLIFVTPHSPMAQPWPIFGGHIISALIGVASAKLVGDVAIATAIAVSVSVFAMYYIRCLHPPSAATSIIAVLGGSEIHNLGWAFCYQATAINAVLIIIFGILINKFITGRKYPSLHSHLISNSPVTKEEVINFPELSREDFKFALNQLDEFIDVTEEELIDIYQLATKNSVQSKKPASGNRTSKP